MKRTLYSLLFSSAMLVMVSPLHAAVTLTFDDLTGDQQLIPDGYGGLNWSNFYFLNGNDFPGSGYQNGIVSGSNVAFNAYGNMSAFSDTAFTLNSGYFTGAWNDGMSITVDGYNGTTLVDTTTFTVNTSGPTFETFDWTGLTNVTFAASGGTHHPSVYGASGEEFVLDNLTITGPVTPTPEPGALVLLGTISALLIPMVRERYRAAS